jgi:hypothetical protein
MDIKLINAAVGVHIAWERSQKKADKLAQDLMRMRGKFTNEEFNEYLKRIKV